MRILTAPYEERDGWELNVMLLDETLYFEEHISNEKMQEKYVSFASLSCGLKELTRTAHIFQRDPCSAPTFTDVFRLLV